MLALTLRTHIRRSSRFRPPARWMTIETTPVPSDDPPPYPPPPTNTDSVGLLMRLLELPSRDSVHRTFGPKSAIFEYECQDIENSYTQLGVLNFSGAEIKKQPTILMKNALTISNHYNVLCESGFKGVEIRFLNHYIAILNKSINNLRFLAFIPSEVNVSQALSGYLKLDIGHLEFTDKQKLREIRHSLLNEFLKTNFDVPEEERRRIFATYPNIKNKSFNLMYSSLQMLINELGMSRERIIKHPFVLYSDPENLRKILGEPTLGGIDTRELLWRRPKILMSNYYNLMKVQEHLRTFGVPDSAVPRCIEVFTLSANTVYERLAEMRKVKEFSVLANHPRVLRLVHYNSKARARLEYLRKMKVHCVSLHILSSCSDYFEKYTRTGVDRTKGTDIVLFLSRIFKRTTTDLRLTLNRHPNWCHVPCVSVKLTLEFLLKRGFSIESINDNIYILLYPLKRIDQQMRTLKRAKAKYGVEPDAMTEHQQLQMCLYLIEKDFHFAGDGVWMNPMQTADFAGADSHETEFEMLGNYKAKTRRPKNVVPKKAVVPRMV